jgi:hypothetical protein
VIVHSEVRMPLSSASGTMSLMLHSSPWYIT